MSTISVPSEPVIKNHITRFAPDSLSLNTPCCRMALRHSAKRILLQLNSVNSSAGPLQQLAFDICGQQAQQFRWGIYVNIIHNMTEGEKLDRSISQTFRGIGGDKIPEFWGRPSQYTEGTAFLGTPRDHLEVSYSCPACMLILLSIKMSFMVLNYSNLDACCMNHSL